MGSTMPVTRRTALTILGGIAIGYGTVGTTGAFDLVEVDRDLTVTVAEDAQAKLTIEPHPDRKDSTGDYPDFVDVDDDGLVVLSFSDINKEGTTEYDDVIQLTNEGTQNVTISAEALDASGDPVPEVSAYPDDDPTASFGTLGVGHSVGLGIRIEAGDGSAVESVATLRITATSV